MVIGGRPQLNQFELLELIPASAAQAYVASLESELVELHGGPVFLVHDGETGTSDTLIADLVSALQEDLDVSSFAITRLINDCVLSAVSFRIWWAGGDVPRAHTSDVFAVDGVPAAMTTLREGKGIWWHAT